MELAWFCLSDGAAPSPIPWHVEKRFGPSQDPVRVQQTEHDPPGQPPRRDGRADGRTDANRQGETGEESEAAKCEEGRTMNGRDRC